VAINSNTGNVYYAITDAIAEADGVRPTVIASQGIHTGQDTGGDNKEFSLDPSGTRIDGLITIPANKPGLTLLALPGTNLVDSFRILANEVSIGGLAGDDANSNNGFEIAGITGAPVVGDAIAYQVSVGDCDAANTGVRNASISFNNFRRPTTADSYASIQICDDSADTRIYKNVLDGFTIAGVHVVDSAPNSVFIQGNTFREALGFPEEAPFPTSIVDRETLPNGLRNPFPAESITQNIFFTDSVLVGADDADAGNAPDLSAVGQFFKSGPIYYNPNADLNPSGTLNEGISGEGAILAAFFNNEIESTPQPGVSICLRRESLEGFVVDGTDPFGLPNFLDRSGNVADVFSTPATQFQAATALCSVVGEGAGSSLQFQ
jgi:hypothetical protein